MRCTISQNYLMKYSTCFGHVHCPSSGVSQHYIHATGICHASSLGVTNTYCVYTVLRYSWWWTVDMSETCRVFYEINLRNSASRWLSLWRMLHGNLYLSVHSKLSKFTCFDKFSIKNTEGQRLQKMKVITLKHKFRHEKNMKICNEK